MKRICFVTGTRAEFGLMQSTLRAITARDELELQLVATGTHLDRSRGQTIDDIAAAGFKVDRVVPWNGDGVSSRHGMSIATGEAMVSITRALQELSSDIVLVVGDRVEAFAAASAGLLSGKIVAHVHGGDRAQGQLDDTLRHAITKLSHVHFPATAESAKRVLRMGEDRWRVHLVGTPGLDDLPPPADVREPFVLLAFHPTNENDSVEWMQTRKLVEALQRGGVMKIIALGPNNDPGSPGIVRALQEYAANKRVEFHPSLPRADYLGLLSRCAFLIGNSSSGIIEAASAGCFVLDIGPRQAGRQRSKNTTHSEPIDNALDDSIARLWCGGRPQAYTGENVYGSPGAGERIALTFAALELRPSLAGHLHGVGTLPWGRKIIAY